ncbi:hypothetical protein BHE74_00056390 [Ensete ventricosum]|nr:hypothetical protein BHE74_00056390 [Ensete ventricosum]RZS24824.1 hypothetical protein BHM03_00057942 [Ensete ventricosum]
MCVCRLGDYVTLGGRVAIRDHVSIASKISAACPDMSMISLSGLQVRLAANSFVTKDLAESGDYGGFPAVRMVFDSSFLFLCFFFSNPKTNKCLLRCRSLSMSGADSLPNCADSARTIPRRIASAVVPLNVFQLDL